MDEEANSIFLLEICVPTYNRSAHLDRVLSGFSQQISHFGLGQQVSLRVSDNDSTDGTAKVTHKWSSLEPSWNFSKQVSNIGADRNFGYLLERSVAQYVWMFGDDDELTGEAVLSDVVNVLRSHEPDLMLVIEMANTEDYQSVVSFAGPKEFLGFAINRDPDILRRSTWITANIMRRSTLDWNSLGGLGEGEYVLPRAIWSGLRQSHGPISILLGQNVQPCVEIGFRAEGAFPTHKVLRSEWYRFYSYLAAEFDEPKLEMYARKFFQDKPRLVRRFLNKLETSARISSLGKKICGGRDRRFGLRAKP
jgi:glycosyltransferase involved in cell wall biosynthesis